MNSAQERLCGGERCSHTLKIVLVRLRTLPVRQIRGRKPLPAKEKYRPDLRTYHSSIAVIVRIVPEVPSGRHPKSVCHARATARPFGDPVVFLSIQSRRRENLHDIYY